MSKGWSVIAAGVWVAGIILAHGFWSTLAAVFFPLWDVYLVVEKIMQSVGWIT